MDRPPLPLASLPYPDWLRDHRSLLHLGALLLLVLLAGCSAAGSLSMDAVTDDEIAERASRGLGSADEPVDDPEAEMLRAAIENGSATIDSAHPPVREGLPFAYGGAYYDLTWTVVDERTVTSVSLRIDYNATDPAGERVAYEDLPAADRRALEALLPPESDRRVPGYDYAASTRYEDAELERSVLVGEEPTVVLYEGEAYPVAFDGTSEYTVETYRYTATEVADGTEAYAGELKDEHLFALAGLSDAEREVVEAAIEDGYYAEDADDGAFESVMDRFLAHPAVARDETGGAWLVRYDGEVYWARLRYDGFDATSGSGAMSDSGRETPAR